MIGNGHEATTDVGIVRCGGKKVVWSENNVRDPEVRPSVALVMSWTANWESLQDCFVFFLY